MKKLVTILFGIILCIPATKAQWRVNTIGTMPNNQALSIVVAEGRNDGVKRVYATTDTEIWEWTFNGTTWSSSLVVNGITPDLISLTAGQGRNDGNVRLYYTDWASGGKSYEASWNGSSWNVLTVGTVPSGWHSSGITVGKGRNDGINRVYTTGSYGVYEYSWNGSSWSMTNNVASNWSEMYGAIGNSRNDGVNRLLFSASCHWESTWTGSSYNTVGLSNCSSSQGADGVVIGDGRNDGVSRIYVNTELAGRIEYTWNGSGFTPVQVRQASQRGAIHMAALKADQKNRVYMGNAFVFNASSAGPIYEYEWNSSTSQWDSVGVVISAVSGATAFMDAGAGRNDDTLRLYAPDFSTGAIYEITAANPNFIGGPTTVIPEVADEAEVSVSPNPAKGRVKINVIESDQHDYTIRLFGLLGQEVLRVNAVNLSGEYVMDVSGITKGVYLLVLNNGSATYSQKLVIE
ncbi:MAG: T9SS type A sorting domain-containing protein [Flavobacteriales bacterium]|nr:T9SS type A sorting domain-containing protein [Flavobacteriales bacterium]